MGLWGNLGLWGSLGLWGDLSASKFEKLFLRGLSLAGLGIAKTTLFLVNFDFDFDAELGSYDAGT